MNKKLNIIIIPSFSALTIAIPVLIFIFYQPFYSYHFTQYHSVDNNPTFTEELNSLQQKFNTNIIEQKLFSLENNLSRLFLAIKLKNDAVVELNLYDNRRSLIRKNYLLLKVNKKKPRKNPDIYWEFQPIQDSKNKEYFFNIKISKNYKDRIMFDLYDKRESGSQIVLFADNMPIENKTLKVGLVSKFTEPSKKFSLFIEKITLNKPFFVKILLLPIYVLFLISFAIVLRRMVYIILTENQNNEKNF